MRQARPTLSASDVLGVAAGRTATVTVKGENLSPVEVDARGGLTATLVAARPGEVVVRVVAGAAVGQGSVGLLHAGGVRLEVPLAITAAVENEVAFQTPCESFPHALPLPGPSAAVNGAVVHDPSVLLRVDVRAGEVWEVALVAGRVGSPLDALVRLRDPRRVPMAVAGGNARKDRALALRAAIDGPHYIEVGDAEGRTGANFRFRLTVARRGYNPRHG